MEDKKANVRRNIVLTVVGLVAILIFSTVIVIAGGLNRMGAPQRWQIYLNSPAISTINSGFNISGNFVLNATNWNGTGPGSYTNEPAAEADNVSFYVTWSSTTSAATGWLKLGETTNMSKLSGGTNWFTNGTTVYHNYTWQTGNGTFSDNKSYVLNVSALITNASTAADNTYAMISNSSYTALTAQFNVTVDNTKPGILSLASPSAGSVYSGLESRTILINYTINDSTAGVRYVHFSLSNSSGNFSSTGAAGASVMDGTELGTKFINEPTQGANIYNITFDPRNFKTGTYTIYMNVTDYTTSGTTAGNVVTNMTRTIVIDNDTPVITIVSPAANDIIKDSTPWIQIKVSDGDQMRQGATDYGSCKYRMDNETAWVFNTTTNADKGIPFDKFVAINEFKIQHAETLSNNAHNIFAICQDRAGNNGTKAWTFSVDTDRGGGAGPSGRAADIDLGTETTSALSGSQGRVTTFTLGTGDTHTVTITEVTDDSVTLKIESEPIILTLKTGETKKVDVTGDTVNDVSITLNAITDGNADLTITKLQALAAPAGEQVAPAKTGGVGLTAVIVIVVIIAVAGIGYYAYSKKKK